MREVRRIAKLLRKRDIDLIKTIAVFCIVTIHACGNGYYSEYGSFGWLCTLFWGSLTRAGVPLFLMCSGALMLDSDKPLPIKKLWGKSILRLVLALFFWATVYGLYRLADTHDLNAASLWQLFKDLVQFRHESHLYFIHIMLLVYALLPVSRLLTANASRRQIIYFLVIWFVLGIVHPTLRPYWPLRQFGDIVGQWGLNLTWASIGYGVLGWYLHRYGAGHRLCCGLLFALGFFVTFAGTWQLSASHWPVYEGLFNGNTVNVCLMAVGLYGLCLGAQPGAWAEYFSRASFCIYLSHLLVILLFQKIPFTSQTLPCIISIPLVALSAIACSSLLYLLLRRIPFVNKWIF